MFIDTHCHLNDFENIADVIKRANDVNVGAIVCATAEKSDWETALKLCETHKNIFATIGMHPQVAGEKFEIPNFLNHKSVIGIGEIGLDYHYENFDKNTQIELFEQWLNVAKNAGLPVCIHSRDATEDTINILKKFRVNGVMHCYSGSYETAKILMDLGFMFSASGVLTFKNANNLRETFAKIPNDKIVVETDAPWLAPQKYRGQKCEPYMMMNTAEILAEIKNLQLDELEIILENNTKRLFPKCEIL